MEDILTLGALPAGGGRTSFRVWAPDRRTVSVAVEERGRLLELPLERLPGGYFGGVHPLGPGVRYKYCLDGGECFADPCSRFQPEGPHGPSQIVDPSAYRWRDTGWRGVSSRGQVLYELHVGTFSPQGTYAGVIERLPHLREVGVTCLELMPVNTWPGRFNWGYDGVHLYAPNPTYGPPDELRRLVDEAHRLGLGVILDVVYNHLGPDGNYLGKYAAGYFTDRYENDWGLPFDVEGDRRPVRDFLIQNALMWIREYHLDGLRLDATQNVYDASKEHILAELTRTCRAAAKGRSLYFVAENEPQELAAVTSTDRGGRGSDALWIDDFHHTVRVALTGNAEAYCQDYCGTAQELLSCVLRNSLFQGQRYAWQDKRRGSPLHRMEPERAVFYVQNHDQLANTLRGLRLHQVAGDDLARAITTFWLLLPQTPMFFQGQEFFASAPFLYFVDHKAELMPLIQKGRDEFISQFSTAQAAFEREQHQVPIDERAFRRSVLDWRERDARTPIVALHRDVLRLRREDPCFSAQRLSMIAGATLGPRALVLRWFGDTLDPAVPDRLLLLNLGPDLKFDPCPEPLLAPPPGGRWRMLLSSQYSRYGGMGALAPSGLGSWVIPGHCAVALGTSGEEEAE